MLRVHAIRVLVFAGAVMGCLAPAHAAAGKCNNQQINQAYIAMTMVPNGSGNAGDCNPNIYGAGSWSSLNDLEIRIQHIHDCSDPWIGQIYWNLYHRRPTATECHTSNYGGGQWSSYMDLASKVQSYVSHPAPVLAPNQYMVDSRGNLVDYHGTIVATTGSYLIGTGGSELVGPSGGTLITPQPGMVISNDGGSFSSQRSIMSNGKRVFRATIIRR